MVCRYQLGRCVDTIRVLNFPNEGQHSDLSHVSQRKQPDLWVYDRKSEVSALS
jgi:hypothetical protein